MDEERGRGGIAVVREALASIEVVEPSGPLQLQLVDEGIEVHKLFAQLVIRQGFEILDSPSWIADFKTLNSTRPTRTYVRIMTDRCDSF